MNRYSLSIHPNLQEDSFAITAAILRKSQNRPIHSHSFYEFFMVEDGSMAHVFNSQLQILPPRTLALVVPADIHSIDRAPDAPWVVYTNVVLAVPLFEETVAMVTGELDLPSLSTGIVVPDIAAEAWEALVTKVRLLRKMHKIRPQGGQRVSVKALLLDVLALIANPPDPDPIPAWLASAYREMSKLENLQAGLARFIFLSGRSQEHLTRSMRRYYGISPTSYINSLRLKQVAHQLLISDEKILDIFVSAGFNSLSYAQSLFTQRYGLPPSAYRETYHINQG